MSARRRPAGAVAALAAGGALLLATPAPTATAATASETLAGTASGTQVGTVAVVRGGPVRILVERLDPKSPRPGDMLTIAGQVQNTGTDTVRGLRLLASAGARISSRSALAEAAAGAPATPRSPETPLSLPEPLGAGKSASFTYTVALEDLGLTARDEIGAYPVRLEARGRTGSTVRVLGEIRSFLPWFPDGVGKPTRLAWIWPLVDVPRRGVSDVLRDDGLAVELTATGRLGALLDIAQRAGRPVAAPPTAPGEPVVAPPPAPGAPAAPAPSPGAPVAVTWATDPELLETAQLMSGPYDVAARKGPPRRGGGTDAARAWLSQLRSAVAGQPVLALPYGDPDTVALTRSGLDGDVGVAVKRSATVSPVLLGVPALAGLSWPPDGLVTSAALDTLVSSGTTAVVLSDATLRLPAATRFSPGAQGTLDSVGGRIQALVADSTLDDIVATGSDFPDGPRLAEQRFLVETAMFTAERPGGSSRDVVIAPPRRWAPKPAYAEAVLRDTGSVPWLTPATLPDLLAAPIAENRRASLAYPDGAAAAELSVAYLGGVSRARGLLREFQSILPDDDVTTPPLRLGLLRSESSAWRRNIEGGVVVLDTVRGAVDAMRAKVRIVPSPGFTLSSSTGTILVTIANDLSQPARVQLRVDAKNFARLGGPLDEAQTVNAGRRASVPVRVEALTSGRFPVYATLLTPEGRELGGRVALSVRSTAYGRVALGITGTAFAILLVTVAVRLVRRGLRARGTAPGTA